MLETTNLLIDFALIGALSPIIIGLVQVMKEFTGDRYAKVMSIVIGVLGYMVLASQALPIEIFGGIVAGLTASGLYSYVRPSVERDVKEKLILEDGLSHDADGV